MITLLWSGVRSRQLINLSIIVAILCAIAGDKFPEFAWVAQLIAACAVVVALVAYRSTKVEAQVRESATNQNGRFVVTSGEQTAELNVVTRKDEIADFVFTHTVREIDHLVDRLSSRLGCVSLGRGAAAGGGDGR